MKKTLLSILLMLITTAIPALAELQEVVSITTEKANQSGKVSSYTSSFSLINQNDKTQTWTVKSFNNNNNDWNLIKTGSKSGAISASVATDFAIAKAISQVTINMEVTSAQKSNFTITLDVSSDSKFSDDNTTSYATSDDYPTSAGDVKFVITNPIENGYYRVNFVTTAKTANGCLILYNLKYFAEENESAVPDKPVMKVDGQKVDDEDYAMLWPGQVLSFTSNGATKLSYSYSATSGEENAPEPTPISGSVDGDTFSFTFPDDGLLYSGKVWGINDNGDGEALEWSANEDGPADVVVKIGEVEVSSPCETSFDTEISVQAKGATSMQYVITDGVDVDNPIVQEDLTVENGVAKFTFSVAGFYTFNAKNAAGSAQKTIQFIAVDPKVYNKVTKAAQLKNGGKYIIVCSEQKKAMNTTNTSNSMGSTSVSFDDDEMTSITNPAADVIVFNLKADGENWQLIQDGTEQGLNFSDDGANLNLSETISSPSITIDGSGNAAISTGSNRQIKYRSSTSEVFKNYSTSSSTSEYFNVQLFKFYAGPELGVIEGAIEGGDAIKANDEITVEPGTKMTFACENAESMKVYEYTDGGDVEITDGVAFADAVLSWTPTSAFDQKIITIKATLGEQVEELTFAITSTSAPAAPVVYLDGVAVEADQDGDYDLDVWPGQTIKIYADGATHLDISDIDTVRHEGDTYEFTIDDTFEDFIWTVKGVKVVGNTEEAGKEVYVSAEMANPEAPVVTVNGFNYTIDPTSEDASVIVSTDLPIKATISAKGATGYMVGSNSDVTDTKKIEADENGVYSFAIESYGTYIVYAYNTCGTHDMHSTSYAITFQAKPQSVTATVDFSQQSWIEYAAATTITWTTDVNGISFDTKCENAEGKTTYPKIYSGVLRVYGLNGNAITINAPAGYQINSLVFTVDTANSNGNVPVIDGTNCTQVVASSDGSSAEVAATASYSDYSYTYATPAAKSVLTPSTSANNLRISKVVIALTGTKDMVNDAVIDQNADSEAVYYNLQGVRVTNPTAGLYIVRIGNTARKVLVR